jgi:multidrug resistance efflux pump
MATASRKEHEVVRTYLIPLLAIIGVLAAVYTVIQGSKPPIAQPPVIEPPRAPYQSFVAGSGLIEAASENIAVGSPVGAVVMALHIKVGDAVKTGDPLFELDSRDLKAELAVRESAAKVAQDQLARLEAGTRPEAIPPARAKVSEAESSLKDVQNQLTFWEQLQDPKAVSAEQLSQRRFAVQTAQARLDQAKADLALLEAGSWSADIAVARSQLEQAKAQVDSARVEVERRTIRAPIDGRILQVNIRLGEFAQAGALSTPLLLMGRVDPLNVRIDIDENDAWRVKPDKAATAYLRGNKDISMPLTFVRFEPYVVPKRSLTGDSTERVDTRVLQVIYSFDPKGKPVFVGQQVDAYIEAPPLSRTSTEAQYKESSR